ncbi:MAG: hypothetical protein COA86_11705, partial [Kangiella sp.]
MRLLLSFFILFFLASCSSTNKKTYKINTPEISINYINDVDVPHNIDTNSWSGKIDAFYREDTSAVILPYIN